MNSDIEYEIVKKFVRNNKQERIVWELKNRKKRQRVIFNNFYGTDIFADECLHPTKYRSEADLEEYLFNLSKSDKVYYMGESYIGYLSLKQAVHRAWEGEIGIIYCGNGIGYYQGEQEIGKPPRYMLLKKE